MKDTKTLVRVTLKESRGDGDAINIQVDGEESITIKEGFVRVVDFRNEVFYFSERNVLYIKLYRNVNVASSNGANTNYFMEV